MISDIDPQVFMFDKRQVRTVVKDGELWFVGVDVCRILGYTNPTKAMKDHCKSAELLKPNDSLPLVGFTTYRGNTIIPERDVYRLIMRSKLPSAEKFEEWVVGEVLPQIRKTGCYVPAPVPANPLDLMQAMLDSIRQQDQRMMALEHKVNTIVDDQFYAVAGYAGKCGCKPLSPTQVQTLGRKASKLSRDMGYDMGKTHHPKYPQGINTYHTDILGLIFANL